jgi:hypothetical protein
MMKPVFGWICLGIKVAAIVACVAGCQGTYYKAMEKLGKHKREILVDRVENARDARQSAKEQFQTALERFSAVVKVPAGELQSTYNQLSNELQRSARSPRSWRRSGTRSCFSSTI